MDTAIEFFKRLELADLIGLSLVLYLVGAAAWWLLSVLAVVVKEVFNFVSDIISVKRSQKELNKLTSELGVANRESVRVNVRFAVSTPEAPRFENTNNLYDIRPGEQETFTAEELVNCALSTLGLRECSYGELYHIMSYIDAHSPYDEVEVVYPVGANGPHIEHDASDQMYERWVSLGEFLEHARYVITLSEPPARRAPLPVRVDTEEEPDLQTISKPSVSPIRERRRMIFPKEKP